MSFLKFQEFKAGAFRVFRILRIEWFWEAPQITKQNEFTQGPVSSSEVPTCIPDIVIEEYTPKPCSNCQSS